MEKNPRGWGHLLVVCAKSLPHRGTTQIVCRIDRNRNYSARRPWQFKSCSQIAEDPRIAIPRFLAQQTSINSCGLSHF